MVQRIAILGATSQIAKDLILSLAADGVENISLFARRPGVVAGWLANVKLAGRYPVCGFASFGTQDFDAAINFVGVGNPARAAALGNAIFDLTLQFDEMVLDYLRRHPHCRYLFMSSGAAYGAAFDKPAERDSRAVVTINDLPPQEWYGAAKLHAECRHRAHPEWAIVDVRIFNYFSRSQDLSARYMITDIMRAMRDGALLKISPDNVVRDFLHPVDFYNLLRALLSSPAANAAVDCYSRAPIDKRTLLSVMQSRFGLRYEFTDTAAASSATGVKPCYYSLNRRAADFGYQPTLSSLEAVLREAEAILHGSL
ncbi:MAG: NAD-dependent epimerase/dehydratase family protein [Betaproteobacteria bacterium]|nr:NAD-dependent epimerase/dehydratase family protein [Betaproteobacteria bacterium]